ncbi:hypothetical protein DPMN_096387 [Dreissena polymorpha]|uniref:Secreted protein n=1 Tax=Dreissena polymorpha TaxID=45954 RepID=A0A9D4L891_DREPO|nr:hypothetical protein DPMN_096387 [Dreissena polymorpha]
MLRNIGNVACFIVVLMTSHHVTGQAHDVAQLNKRLTIIKHSFDDDIVNIRLEVMELKMIVEQIVGGQRITSDGSDIDCGDPTPDRGTVNTTETTVGTVVQISSITVTY